jgi:Peptidase inhibitor family I36
MAITRIITRTIIVFVSVLIYSGTSHASTEACRFYKHTNARGRVLSVEPGQSSYIGYGLNDEVSTIWIKRGYKVTIFKHNNYRGHRRVLHSSDRRGWRGNGGTYFNLKPLHFNDCLTSYVIEREWPRRITSQMYQRPFHPNGRVHIWNPHGRCYFSRRY